MRGHRRFVSLALTAALVAGGLTVAPAAAFEVLVDTGKTGVPKIEDGAVKPGVICSYEDHAGMFDDELDAMRIRQVKTKSQSKRRRWVGYRFTIFRQSPGDEDLEPIFKSRIVKKQASKSDAAGWPSRTWKSDEDLSASYYRAIVTFIYYKRGSKTKQAGRIRGVMEVHRHTHPTAPNFVTDKPGDGDGCFYSFWT